MAPDLPDAGALDLDRPESRRLSHAVAQAGAVLLHNAGGCRFPPPAGSP
ncbi:hypothetical protein ACIRBZ_18615 [Streptomyces sp. NPDC094038]